MVPHQGKGTGGIRRTYTHSLTHTHILLVKMDQLDAHIFCPQYQELFPHYLSFQYGTKVEVEGVLRAHVLPVLTLVSSVLDLFLYPLPSASCELDLALTLFYALTPS